jgi:serine/threonine protein kinase/tetratricopeptide (TPR) repeat protein
VTPERFARLKEIVLTARRLDGGARAAYLAEAGAGDPTLRDEAESLLAHESDTPSILETGGASGRMARDLAASLAAPPLPSRIGPYEITGILGEGGMGIVYHARQSEPLKREVALKLIKRGMDTERVVGRFESERQALARMDHPGIARVLDAGADASGRPYFVMELVRGMPLVDYADSRRLTLRRRLDLFLKVCHAVQHAHQKGIIHRDLKPTNVLVTEQDGEPQPKIIDFGIAKAVEEPLSGRSLFTEEGQLVGTPEYMSPEQAGFGAAGVDTRTDVYSLGVLLYELLTGQRPYRLPSRILGEIQRIIGEEEPEKPSTALARAEAADTAVLGQNRGTTIQKLRRELAGDIDNIILMTLRKEPDRRYPSVERFAEDLRRHLDGLPVMARQDTFGYRTGKFIRRHRIGVGTGVAAVIVLIGFAVSMAVQSSRIARERDRALDAENRARTEAATATRVSDFLVELFEVADPYVSQGDTITARELLDKGADRIGDLAGVPEVQASLMSTMSRAYVGLRIRDRAVPLAEQALETRRGLFGEKSAAVAESYNNLGAAYAMKGDQDAAETNYRKALALRRELLGPEHMDIAESASLLALCLHTLSRFAEAESLYRESLAMTRKFKGEEDPAVTWGINNLGGILHAQGQAEEAEALLREALSRARAADTDSILMADIMSELAVILKGNDDLDGAEPFYRDALAIRERIFGDHPITAQSHNNIGVFLRKRGDPAAAIPHLRKAVAIHKRLRGDDHLDVAIGLGNLASALNESGEYAEAEDSYREAIRSVENSMGRDYWVYGQVRYGYGAFLFERGRTADAEPHLHSGYEVLKNGLGEHHRRTLIALRKLVELYDTRGERAKAAEYRALIPPEEGKK